MENARVLDEVILLASQQQTESQEENWDQNKQWGYKWTFVIWGGHMASISPLYS